MINKRYGVFFEGFYFRGGDMDNLYVICIFFWKVGDGVIFFIFTYCIKKKKVVVFFFGLFKLFF